MHPQTISIEIFGCQWLRNNQLQKQLAKSNYFPCQTITGLYKHAVLDTTFTLVVDDFGIKYTSKKNALQLLNCLQQLYTLATYWKGELYIELTLRWDHVNRTVDLSMPGYVERVLQQF